MHHRPKVDILELFRTQRATPHGFTCISAPMVRYSKREFRQLLRQHGVRLAFTPMIISDSFNNSEKARLNEFTTSSTDQPLIAQFAACNAQEFVTSAQLIAPFVDGVDLNCGCPQWWAIQKGYGCGLLRNPELVKDIVSTARRTLNANFSISVKIRLLAAGETGLRDTVELARQLERCGVTFLTLHGRTAWQRTSDPLNVAAMAEVKKSVQLPLVVNGNVRSWSDACELYEQTRADGVMAARGLLTDPTLFDPRWRERCGSDEAASLRCAQQWLDIAARADDRIQFQCLHHHLTFMWSSHVSRKLRIEFNNFTKKQQIFDFFAERFDMRPTATEALSDDDEYTECSYAHCAPSNAMPANAYSSANTVGKYFDEFKAELAQVAEKDDFELEGSFFTELAE